MQVCPVCAGQGCSHCNGKGFHGINEQLGFVTINRNTGTGISVGTGLLGAVAWPMLTGGFGKDLNSNRKAKNMLYGFLIGSAIGALGSYAGYQVQN